MAFYKNEANSVTVLAIDTGSSNAPKTGDALNITCQIVIDSGSPAATTDTNPTELNSSSMPGLYRFDLTAAECNADHIVLGPSSSTGSIEIDPVMIFTTDEALFQADVSSLATTSALTDVATDVDTIISTGSTGPWTTGSGGGAGSSYNYTNTVTNNGVALDGATVWFTANGTVTPSLGQDITNALGEFELFANTDGPFDVHVFKAGDYDSQTYASITFSEI